MVIGDKRIKIVSGDTYQKRVIIDDIDNEIIKSIYFTSKELNICRELVFRDGAYILTLNSEETKYDEIFRGYYDLTIEFIDGKINTIVYQKPILIEPKENEVCCYGK